MTNIDNQKISDLIARYLEIKRKFLNGTYDSRQAGYRVERLWREVKTLPTATQEAYFICDLIRDFLLLETAKLQCPGGHADCVVSYARD